MPPVAPEHVALSIALDKKIPAIIPPMAQAQNFVPRNMDVARLIQAY